MRGVNSFGRLRPVPNAITKGLALQRRQGDRASVFAPGVAQAVGPVNLLLWSHTVSSGNWGKSNVNTPSATSVVEDTATTSHLVNQTISVLAGVPATYAAIVQAGTRTSCEMRIQGGSGAAGVAINLTTGALANIGVAWGAGFSAISASVVDLGSGQYLVALNATSAASYPAAMLLLSNAGGATNYTGNGTGSINVFGQGAFQGTYTASEILAQGGIPLTTTAPAAARYSHWITGAALAPSGTTLGPVNRQVYSNDLSQWVSYGGSYSANQPDARGGTTASRITAAYFGGGYYISTASFVPGQVYTIAHQVKSLGVVSNVIQLGANQSIFTGAGGDRVVNFDCGTGQLFSKSAEITSWSAARFGSDYWIITATFTCAAAVPVIAAIASYGTAAGQQFLFNGGGVFQGALTADQLVASGGIPVTASTPAANTDPSTQALGPNLVNNGDFSGGATGWILGQPTAGTVAIESGGMRIRSTDGTLAYFQRGDLQLSIGSTYRVTFTIRGWVNGRLGVTTDGSSNAYVSPAAAGTYSFDTTVTSLGVLQFKRPSGENCDLIVDDISCQLVTTMPIAPWLMDYVESTMNTAAAVDGPVGALTDGSATTGPELATQSSGFTSTAGFTPGNCTLSVSGGNLVMTSTVASGVMSLSFGGSAVNAQAYRGSIRVLTNTAQNSAWFFGGNNAALTTPVSGVGGTGYAEATQTANSTQVAFSMQWVVTAIGQQVVIGSVSMKALTGRHATQGTGANKPTLRRGFVMLSTHSGLLDSTLSWATTGTSVSGGQQGPTGANDAYGILDTTAGSAHLIQGMSYTFAAGRTYTTIALAKAGGSNFVHMPFYASAFGTVWATIDLSNGSVTQSGGSLVQASVVPAGNGFYLISLSATCTASSGGPGCYFWLTPSGTAGYVPSYAGTGTVRIYARAGGVVEGVVTAQQALACGGIPLTTTIAASSALGNYALEFDGAKFMTLGGVPFTATDDHAVVVGARVDDVSAIRTVYAHSNASNHQMPWIYFGTNGKVNAVYWDGTTTVVLTSPLAYIGQDIVIGLRRVGATAVLRINGVQVASASVAVITSQTLTTATLGGFNGSNLQHKGRIYVTAPGRGAVTDAEMLVQERFAAALTGPVPNSLRF